MSKRESWEAHPYWDRVRRVANNPGDRRLSEWRDDDRGVQIGRAAWSAMVDTLYPLKEWENRPLPAGYEERVAIHATFEAVMQLMAQMEAVLARIDNLESGRRDDVA